MHFSFSAVNENASSMKFHFRPKNENEKEKSPAYITEISYGSVAKITFSAQCK